MRKEWMRGIGERALEWGWCKNRVGYYLQGGRQLEWKVQRKWGGQEREVIMKSNGTYENAVKVLFTFCAALKASNRKKCWSEIYTREGKKKGGKKCTEKGNGGWVGHLGASIYLKTQMSARSEEQQSDILAARESILVWGKFLGTLGDLNSPTLKNIPEF